MAKANEKLYDLTDICDTCAFCGDSYSWYTAVMADQRLALSMQILTVVAAIMVIEALPAVEIEGGKQ